MRSISPHIIQQITREALKSHLKPHLNLGRRIVKMNGGLGIHGNILRLLAPGLADYIADSDNKTIRLLVSPNILPEDREALPRGRCDALQVPEPGREGPGRAEERAPGKDLSPSAAHDAGVPPRGLHG